MGRYMKINSLLTMSIIVTLTLPFKVIASDSDFDSRFEKLKKTKSMFKKIKLVKIPNLSDVSEYNELSYLDSNVDFPSNELLDKHKEKFENILTDFENLKFEDKCKFRNEPFSGLELFYLTRLYIWYDNLKVQRGGDKADALRFFQKLTNEIECLVEDSGIFPYFAEVDELGKYLKKTRGIFNFDLNDFNEKIFKQGLINFAGEGHDTLVELFENPRSAGFFTKNKVFDNYYNPEKYQALRDRYINEFLTYVKSVYKIFTDEKSLKSCTEIFKKVDDTFSLQSKLIKWKLNVQKADKLGVLAAKATDAPNANIFFESLLKHVSGEVLRTFLKPKSTISKNCEMMLFEK
tara:strand:- start:7208 stop:8251 length:1044 start_codon:yes stop_codon:yes gene_type:complete